MGATPINYFRAGRGTASAVRKSRARRGAVLIVALLLAALIALGLTSYITLNLSSSRLAKRSFNSYAALNLAEAGTEEAVWSFNRTQRGDATAWNDWTKSGLSAWQKFSGFSFGGNTEGWVKVYVDKATPGPSDRPKVIAQASVNAPGERAVTRMIEVTLRRRSLFASGIVAKDTITFSGAVTSVDSWNSDPDNNDATAPVPYSDSVRRDGGRVSSGAVVNKAVLINQANIWGYVATGGGQPEVGRNGSIRGADTPANVRIDSRRVSTDFNADLSSIAAPTDGTVLTVVPSVLGVLGTKTKWRIPSITLSGTDTLLILGDVTIVLTAGAGTDAISLTGTSQIVIPRGSTLTVYTEADLKIAGRGLFNGNVRPISCQVYGTNITAGGQEFQIAGNGDLVAVVYAPNADVKINGNGDVMGSVVANRVTLVGNAAFHYDESLAAPDANQPFSISKWRELTTAADRAAWVSVFDGW